MSIDEMIMRHTLQAMGKMFPDLPDPQQLSRRPPAQEGSPPGLGTVETSSLSAKTRLEALMLSSVNEQRAEDHPELRKVFEANAEFLKRIAGEAV